jgi:hypothetical protein
MSGDFPVIDIAAVRQPQVSEAITSDTREPSYMFLAAEWNRASVSERAYLLGAADGHNRAERAPPQVRSGLCAGGSRIRTPRPT